MRPVDQLPRSPLPVAVNQNWNLNGVPIVGVVRNELEVPFEGARVRVQRDRRIRVEIVARPNIRVPVGRRIADTPEDKIQFRVIGSGHPRRAAPVFPRLAATPRFMTFLAGSGNRVKAPASLAGLRILRLQEAANSGFPTCNTA